jgi:uncharacterized Fe-S center protein
MSVNVYYLPPSKITKDKLIGIFKRTAFLDQFVSGALLAVKVHFGEKHNYNHLSPDYVKAVVEIIKSYKLNPIVVETSTLYRGARQNRTTHLKLAREHGFAEEYIGAPVEILDGERGENYLEIPTPFKYVKKAKIAYGIEKFAGIVNLAHFKGHFVVGFGGVIKNIAMGLAAKGGKLEMHSQTKFFIKKEKCQRCEICIKGCPAEAIVITKNGAEITKKCIGCASCVEVCPEGAIKINWDEAQETIQKKMAEYAWTILKGRPALHFNFALRITPNCDCMDFTEDPITNDLGLFVSQDPVACDKSVLDRTLKVLKELYPQLNPEILLEYSEIIGLGVQDYQLVTLDDE